MNESSKPRAEASEHPPTDQVVTALRLGWAIAELLGRLRQGARPYHSTRRSSDVDPDAVPRLVVGDGVVKGGGASFWFTAQRIVAFYDVLAPVKPENEDSDTHVIRQMPEVIRQWLTGQREDFFTVPELRDLLNRWSMMIWARLNARGDELARALTLGMSLADTHYYMRKPERRRRHFSQEDWRTLLSTYRLDVERGRLESLKPHLPPYVSDVLQSHLRQWSIGNELEVGPDGQLRRRTFLFRRSHSLGLLSWHISEEKWRDVSILFRLTHPLGFFKAFRRPYRSPEIAPEQEAALQEALRQQVKRWEGLLFGLREPISYLYRSDRRRIVWLMRALVFIVIVVVVGVPLGLGVVRVAGQAATSLITALLYRMQEAGAQVSDWLALAKLLLGLLTSLGASLTGLGILFRFLRWLYRAINHRLTVYFIARRMLVPWDRAMRRGEQE
jgi:hypothetical protein